MVPEGLIYYPDHRPGITRRRCGLGFSYRSPDGTTIADTSARKRIEALAIPPAYRHVWISPRLNGHLQATGYDAAHRKQYRYHPDWTTFRAQRKFGDLPRFGRSLARLRDAIRRGLDAEPGTREFALAAVLALIDRLSLRPGHPDYVDANGTFGATTLLSQHLRVDAEGTQLRFPAKGGKKVSETLRDTTLARALHKLDDLPGAPIATWMDGKEVRSVSPDMLGAFMTDVTGEDGMTPKTFRTWNGSVAAMEVALTQEDLTIRAMSEAAASRLNNTPTIARNSYIHPEIINLSETGFATRTALREADTPTRLRKPERALLKLIG